NATMGWVFLRDPERNRFHLASWYNVPEALGQRLLAQQDEPLCPCQENLFDGETAVFPCHQLASCPILETCALPDLPKRHTTIPIEARGQHFGVMNLLCNPQHRLSDDDLDLLSDIGAQISEIVANAWLRLKLEEKEIARQALLESLVEAQEDERGRLARELHDGAGQMLTSLLVGIKALERKAESPTVRSGLESLLEMTSETIEQVRELSYRLRPAALEQFGLDVALETLVADMAAEAGIKAQCHLELGELALPAGIDVTLYRIAQECLTNVVRHAQATAIEVALKQEDHNVVMRIEDDGRGFSPTQLTARPGQRHLGLISMRERAAIVGGQLDVYSAPGQGTTVEVSVPIYEAVQDAG
ncbi:MAG: sensor histidine kinase, partial [Anaerolineae bacterium]|nr:sensor histidine kinase [Anaerolineae bacterium]